LTSSCDRRSVAVVPPRHQPRALLAIDVEDQGNGTVNEQRMHQLIGQPKPIADRLFEIEFLDSRVEAYCFTFG
jgi:Thioredoxin like C-terminal domain